MLVKLENYVINVTPV